jgi:transposase-like protein
LDAEERPYHALKAIPDVDNQILQGIASGLSLKRVAEQFGVHDTAILRRVQKHPEYRDILRTSLELRAAQREDELEAASDNVSVTRADRLLGHARWLLERCVPEHYGAKTQVSVTVGLSDELQKIAERKRQQLQEQVIHSAASQLLHSTSEITDAEYTSTPGE